MRIIIAIYGSAIAAAGGLMMPSKMGAVLACGGLLAILIAVFAQREGAKAMNESVDSQTTTCPFGCTTQEEHDAHYDSQPASVGEEEIAREIVRKWANHEYMSIHSDPFKPLEEMIVVALRSARASQPAEYVRGSKLRPECKAQRCFHEDAHECQSDQGWNTYSIRDGIQFTDPCNCECHSSYQPAELETKQ